MNHQAAHEVFLGVPGADSDDQVCAQRRVLILLAHINGPGVHIDDLEIDSVRSELFAIARSGQLNREFIGWLLEGDLLEHNRLGDLRAMLARNQEPTLHPKARFAGGGLVWSSKPKRPRRYRSRGPRRWNG